MSTRLDQKLKRDMQSPIDGSKFFQYGKPRICVVKARNSLFRSKFGFGIALSDARGNKIHRIGYIQGKGPGYVAGLRTNDIIIKVNEIEATEFGHEDLINFLRNYEKDSLKLTVVQPIQGDEEPMA